jgi:predicted RNA-binding protein YlqC (UPF0109 family)
VEGRRDGVKVDKERVMEVIEKRGKSVKMKMEVRYNDKYKIIGKGGMKIKKVMEEKG